MVGMSNWTKSNGGDQRTLGSAYVKPIGLGCMNMSFAYGTRPEESYSIRLLNEALDEGYDHFDTAAIYGAGHNEDLIGKAISHRRSEFFLASKCVLCVDDDGKRLTDASPKMIRKTLEGALKRLNTDHIDLYYLHRPDPKIAIEESMGEMSRLAEEGKIGSIGLSEVSSDWIKRAHAVHPVAALQTEYSLWTRNPEIAALKTCEELGITFVAFSPVARQFLTGKLRDVSTLEDNDLRKSMPRFEPETYAKNLQLLDGFAKLADQANCSMAQLALAWLLAQGKNIVAIPGTKEIGHMRENWHAGGIKVDASILAKADALINQKTVIGTRYNNAMQATVTTERFAEETA